MKRKASTEIGESSKVKRSALDREDEDDEIQDEEENVEEMADISQTSSAEEDVMDTSQRPGFISKAGEVGIIEKISLKNFMCHNRLEVPFGPNINFVVGRNGSGKSAVVTALVVGLGGKASTTNRGNKLRGFIKTGKHTGEVEIKLRNRGVDSYKPELYGESIIVVRQFKSDGSTQYKLKSKDGKVVSQKKEELSRIMDQFNIQVDNPVAVLNQDTSKNFLHSKSPRDKYRFFLKATQLEQIKEEYRQASDNKVITQDIIKQKMTTLPKLEKEVFSWEQKFKALTAIDELRMKDKRLRKEMAWAWVIEKERGLAPIEKELKQEEARLPRFKQKAEEAKTSLDTINSRMTELTTMLNGSGEDVKALQPAHQEAKKSLKEQKLVTRNAQNEVKKIEGAVQRTTREINSVRERIQELQTTAQHDYESERQARLAKIDNLKEKLASVEAQETTTDHMLDQFRNAITKYRNDQYKLGQDAQQCQTQIDKLERNLQTLKASQGNKLKRFGGFMPQLIDRIEMCARRGQFHCKPLGPLGAYMTLKEQRWALAVESCIKGLLTSFICHDYHDEKLLEKIIAENCPPHYRPTVIVRKFREQVYDVSQKGARSDTYPTLFSMIQSDYPMVYNTLIDQRKVECIILIEDGKEARQVMDPDRQTGQLRNCREAFTIRGDQVFSAPTFRYYSSNLNKSKYLTASVEDDIASTTADIARLRRDSQQKKEQQRQLQKEIEQNRQEERRTETQLMKIREQKRKLSMEITELKNVEDPAPVDVATYEEEVRVLEGQLESWHQQLSCKKTVMTEQETKLTELESSFKEIEAQMRSKIEAGDSIKEMVGNVVNEIETSKTTKKHYDTKLKEQEKKVKELKERAEKYTAEIKSDEEKAMQIHPERINTRRTPKNLESEINQINKQIQNEEKQRGDPDEITRQYREKKDAYKKIQKEVQQLQFFVKCLDSKVTVRLEKFAHLRRFIAMRTKCFFIVMLNNRNYNGKLKFNHQNESLEMTVQPNKSGQGDGAKDLKSLSGGERSFSTVCFILSLWDAMESPFRCLDEFDVFMDMVNRRISMDMMMDAAKSQSERQFIFLSPLNMSALKIDGNRNVRIFRMPTPETGQTTLTYADQNEEEEEEG